MQFRNLGLALLALALTACSDSGKNSKFAETVRFATYHVDMAYDEPMGYNRLVQETSNRTNPRLQNLAAMLQQEISGGRPDVLLLTGFATQVRESGIADEVAIRQFQENYLEVSQGAGLSPLNYNYRYVAATNSGQLMALDVDGDGIRSQYPEDTNGYGYFHGQDSFVLLSRYELDTAQVRTFRDFKWADVDDARAPGMGDNNTMPDEVFRELSIMSSNMVDIPLKLPDGRRVSLVATQLESPAPRDDTQRPYQRSRDQLRFLADYIDDRGKGDYIQDDNQRPGGVALNRPFVLLGHLASDEDQRAHTLAVEGQESYDGDSGSVNLLLTSYLLRFGPALNQNAPGSAGATDYFRDSNSPHLNGQTWTNINGWRTDYVLPHNDLFVADMGVFWPALGASGSEWLYDVDGNQPSSLSSGKRLVWMDIDFGQ
ncbi:endonuclease/exonuclease/phosphatase family protein [Ferrimonas marina]|uniref:Endonuclease/Exonuclease/phosphatase family protein n=1 Tax=Ferrimonas marina TaxID=299255 RepID=A0A1M5Z8J7_9GAMM|nr:endonuclease/exonuclease/phosphatase family protein [Ferrimonas marina]SHI20550.1 Endonuclease/Exonuclease/phosphatase family protein [Ferrimonas marina]